MTRIEIRCRRYPQKPQARRSLNDTSVEPPLASNTSASIRRSGSLSVAHHLFSTLKIRANTSSLGSSFFKARQVHNRDVSRLLNAYRSYPRCSSAAPTVNPSAKPTKQKWYHIQRALLDLPMFDSAPSRLVRDWSKSYSPSPHISTPVTSAPSSLHKIVVTPLLPCPLNGLFSEHALVCARRLFLGPLLLLLVGDALLNVSHDSERLGRR